MSDDVKREVPSVWVTRYALTSGIQEHKSAQVDDRYAYVKYKGGFGSTQLFRLGTDAFLSESEALENAHKRALQAIDKALRSEASMQKLAQSFLKKLRGMS